jgi:hypothetical protein
MRAKMMADAWWNARLFGATLVPTRDVQNGEGPNIAGQAGGAFRGEDTGPPMCQKLWQGV